MDFLTIDLITNMVLWISIVASVLLCVLVAMIYFKESWFEPNQDK